MKYLKYFLKNIFLFLIRFNSFKFLMHYFVKLGNQIEYQLKLTNSFLDTQKSKKNYYKVVSIAEYCNGCKTNSYSCLPFKNVIDVQRPTVVGLAHNNFFSGLVRLPSVYIAYISDVYAIGRTSILLKDGFLLSDELSVYDYQRYRVKYVRSILKFNPHSKEAEVSIPSSEYISIDTAIHLLYDSSDNYYHWLIEVLPRLSSLLESKVNFVTTPFLIDAKLPEQCVEALKIIVGESAQFIHVDEFSKIRIKNLIFPSFISLCLDLQLDKFVNYSKDFLISPLAVNFLNQTFFSKVLRRKPFRKVFVVRSNARYGRMLLNEKNIRSHAIRFGFEIINPECLSFIEQAQIFSDSEMIICPGGSAMANIVFCQPKAKILMLTFDYVYLNPYIFSTIAQSLDITLHIMCGKGIDPYDQTSNYIIPIDLFSNYIEEYFKIQINCEHKNSTMSPEIQESIQNLLLMQ